MPDEAGHPIKREHSPIINEKHREIPGPPKLQIINMVTCSNMLKYNIKRRERRERITRERKLKDRENKGKRKKKEKERGGLASGGVTSRVLARAAGGDAGQPEEEKGGKSRGVVLLLVVMVAVLDLGGIDKIESENDEIGR